MQISTKIGKRGSLIIPNAIRNQLGLQESDLVLVSAQKDGRIIIEPARAVAKIFETISSKTSQLGEKKSQYDLSDLPLRPNKIALHTPNWKKIGGRIDLT